jgi:cytosine/adenosine deaminase-related metal-dependent hydrolase
MDPSSVLLKNGIVLQHDDRDNVDVLRNTDILIAGHRIAQIGQDLSCSDDTTIVIDCRDKIVSPGFIDAHHHLWQTQLKGRHGDHTLLYYIIAGTSRF